LVTASEFSEKDADNHRNAIQKHAQGLIFIGTPHQGSALTPFAKLQSYFGYWMGSRTHLLEYIELGSSVNQDLNDAFLKAYGSMDIVDFFETVPESVRGVEITHVCVYIH
jgi:hypothetical protein